MRIRQPKPGQTGKYWLSKKPGRTGAADAWCRTWYEPDARQTRRVSLGTADVDEATRLLAEWVILNERPVNARPDQILIDKILIDYWEDRGKNAVSDSVRFTLKKWQEYWAGKTVEAITPQSQKQFRTWLGDSRFAKSTIDRTLSSGRAALKHAVRQGTLIAAPHIFMTETEEDRISRPPMGHPLEIEEMARFFNAIEHAHLFKFAIIAANTLARPEAIRDLRRRQYDPANARLNLNPPGRTQTKKFRPVIPVSQTLRPWLAMETDPHAAYISNRGREVKDLRRIWSDTVVRAGLQGMRINRYSFRHGMARLIRRRGVSLEDVGLLMGHQRQGASRTTRIYAPDDPSYLRAAVMAIDDVMSEVQAIARIPNWDRPPLLLDGLIRQQSRLTNRREHLSQQEHSELHELIRSGKLTPAELSERFGVSQTAIYKHMKKLGVPRKWLRRTSRQGACRRRA